MYINENGQFKKVKNFDKLNDTYLEKRKKEYGTVEFQLEYIVENGFEKFVERQCEIKKLYPKD